MFLTGLIYLCWPYTLDIETTTSKSIDNTRRCLEHTTQPLCEQHSRYLLLFQHVPTNHCWLSCTLYYSQHSSKALKRMTKNTRHSGYKREKKTWLGMIKYNTARNVSVVALTTTDTRTRSPYAGIIHNTSYILFTGRSYKNRAAMLHVHVFVQFFFLCM